MEYHNYAKYVQFAAHLSAYSILTQLNHMKISLKRHLIELPLSPTILYFIRHTNCAINYQKKKRNRINVCARWRTRALTVTKCK